MFKIINPKACLSKKTPPSVRYSGVFATARRTPCLSRDRQAGKHSLKFSIALHISELTQKLL